MLSLTHAGAKKEQCECKGRISSSRQWPKTSDRGKSTVILRQLCVWTVLRGVPILQDTRRKSEKEKEGEMKKQQQEINTQLTEVRGTASVL